jgi:1-deoxy-D-xylulose-5-phosphate reductoisomerase
LKIAKRGGTWPAALSGADEMAVELFLSRRIRFDEIYSIINEALKSYDSVSNPDIEDILAASNWAKNRVKSLAEV